jgi:hypothetical protein
MHCLSCGWVCCARSNTRATDATASNRHAGSTDATASDRHASSTDADPRPPHADTGYHG